MSHLNSRGTVVKSIRRIDADLLGADELDDAAFEAKQKLLQNSFDKFQSLHDALVESTKDKDEIDSHDVLYADVEETYIRASTNLLRLRQSQVKASVPVEKEQKPTESSVQTDSELPVPTAETADEETVYEKCNSVDLRLVPLNIKIFDGRDENWLQFRDMFVAMVHKRKMDPTLKLARLQQYVDADKVPMVAGVYTGGYDDVWEQLKKRYDRPMRLVEAHCGILMALDDFPDESKNAIRSIVDTMRNYVRAMKVMKLQVTMWDAVLIPILMRKIPRTAKAHYKRMCPGDHIPVLEDVLLELENYAETVADEVPAKPIQRASSVNNNQPNAVRHVRAALQCGICGQEHGVSKCSTFKSMATQERIDAIRSKRLCFNCFDQSHVSRNCNAGVCRNCGKKHHSLLCLQKSVNSSDTSSVVVPGSSAQPKVLPRQ